MRRRPPGAIVGAVVTAGLLLLGTMPLPAAAPKAPQRLVAVPADEAPLLNIFSDLSKPYYFGVAVFDNAQIAHGASDAFTLVFQRR